MERHTPLAGKALLDFGCGSGRLYFGFRRRNEPASYLGVDVRSDVITWAQRSISAANSRFRFIQADICNERYNPRGQLQNERWSDVLKSTFDVVYCYSVLSHLTETDAAEVLALFARHTGPGAFVFLTAFVADQEDHVVINPSDTGIEIQGPLHVVRYQRDYFRRLMLRQFDILAEHPGTATDGQALYVLRRR